MQGFVGAVRRFADAAAHLPADQSEPVHVALFEALGWLDSLLAGAQGGAIGAAPAKRLLGDHHVKALIFVRGRTHHHWSSVAYSDPTIGEWVWQRLEVLPIPPKADFVDEKGQEAFLACLEQKPVLTSLQHVERLLEQISS